MTNIVLIGPPGSGKGTQAAELAVRTGHAHISTGDLFRDHVQRKTPLGLEAERHISSGTLVPDEVTVQMLIERLDHPDTAAGFILDGFPRTIRQVRALEDLLAARGRGVDLVLVLDVPVKEALTRIETRSRDSGRSDDDSSVAHHRQSVYIKETEPIIARYAAAGLLSLIDGLGAIQDVSDRIDATIRRRAAQQETTTTRHGLSTTH